MTHHNHLYKNTLPKIIFFILVKNWYLTISNQNFKLSNHVKKHLKLRKRKTS